MNKGRGRAVIFSNGEYGDPAGIKQRLRSDDYLVCADGALAEMAALGLRPALLVGDFDSVEPALLAQARAEGVEVVTSPHDQDYTDTELALTQALARGYRQILLVGAWGGRPDHALANLFLVAPFAQQAYDISLTDGCWDIYMVAEGLVLNNCLHKTVSLLALTPQTRGVFTQGLRWPLADSSLSWGQGLGISNVAVVPRVEIKVGEGLLLVIVAEEER